MKAYQVYWKDGSKNSTAHGNTVVIAVSITTAIARFQDIYKPDNRCIESVFQEGDEVLIDTSKSPSFWKLDADGATSWTLTDDGEGESHA
jgi:hypothetical protein